MAEAGFISQELLEADSAIHLQNESKSEWAKDEKLWMGWK